MGGRPPDWLRASRPTGLTGQAAASAAAFMNPPRVRPVHKRAKMTDRLPGICKWCGQPTAPGSRGPVPEYCSRGHRQRAYEARSRYGTSREGIVEQQRDRYKRALAQIGDLARSGWNDHQLYGEIVAEALGRPWPYHD